MSFLPFILHLFIYLFLFFPVLDLSWGVLLKLVFSCPKLVGKANKEPDFSQKELW